jgi:hypothetical protein
LQRSAKQEAARASLAQSAPCRCAVAFNAFAINFFIKMGEMQASRHSGHFSEKKGDPADSFRRAPSTMHACNPACRPCLKGNFFNWCCRKERLLQFHHTAMTLAVCAGQQNICFSSTPRQRWWSARKKQNTKKGPARCPLCQLAK